MTTSHITSRFCKTIPAAFAAGLALIGSTAKAIPLNDLVAQSGSISIGDKIFADFGISGFNPGNINVSASIDGGGVYHLTFQGGLLQSNGNGSDTGLFYTVATLSGQPLITMIDQSFNLSSGGNGGLILIGETVRTGSFGGPLTAQSSVGFVLGVGDLNDPEGELEQGDDLNVVPAEAKLWVTKDIFLLSNEGGAVGATILDQSFHQNVPEGGSAIALLGMALMGVEGLRRKLGIRIG